MQIQNLMPLNIEAMIQNETVAGSLLFIEHIQELKLAYKTDDPLQIEFFMPKKLEKQFKELASNYWEQIERVIAHFGGILRSCIKEIHHV